MSIFWSIALALFLALAMPQTIPFLLAFAFGATLARMAYLKKGYLKAIAAFEVVALSFFAQREEAPALFALTVVGFGVELSTFLYSMWKVGLLPYLLRTVQTQAVLRSTVYSIRDLPPGGRAVFYFYPEVEAFTPDIARVYSSLGWAVRLARVIDGRPFGCQVVMCVKAAEDPNVLKANMLRLRRASLVPHRVK